MIETKSLIKTFHDGTRETTVLKGIDFRAEDGEFVAIMGRSGAGKSTFLYQVSLLDHPTSGDVIVNGAAASDMSSRERARFRLVRFGYVFQDYALLPDLTALENVALPLLAQNMSKRDAYEKAQRSLDRVGVGKRLRNLPAQMSGGEQQRVSIARAVAHEPHILFADEPTANLDNESSGIVMSIFKELHDAGQTIIMVTHEREYGNMAQKIVTFDDGKILSAEPTKLAK